LTGWQIFQLPLDDKMLANLKYGPAGSSGPGFYRARVTVETPGDCFLDMRPWGKGFAWLNGHNLGRYWNIGPQQTMYLPGPWLKPGQNEIVILDLLGPQRPVVAALSAPILNELRLEMDFARGNISVKVMQIDSSQPAHTGAFAPGSKLQEIKFGRAGQGAVF